MTITDVDKLIAGFDANGYYGNWGCGSGLSTARIGSSWNGGGMLGNGAFDTTLNGVVLSQSGGIIAGAVPFYDPTPSPDSQQIYLAKVAQTGMAIGQWGMLCDRLWHNGGYTITSTSVQSSTTPAWPPRDENGSSNGVNVLLGLEVSATVGAASGTVTVKYTNQAGTTGQTAVGLGYGVVSGGAAGLFYPISLAAGDYGVRALESIQLSATWTSGTINMVAYRPLAMFVCNTGSGSNPSSLNFMNSGVRMYPGSVPFFLGGQPGSGAFAGGHGFVSYARG
jgi:hypothetical protein